MNSASISVESLDSVCESMLEHEFSWSCSCLEFAFLRYCYLYKYKFNVGFNPSPTSNIIRFLPFPSWFSPWPFFVFSWLLFWPAELFSCSLLFLSLALCLIISLNCSDTAFLTYTTVLLLLPPWESLSGYNRFKKLTVLSVFSTDFESLNFEFLENSRSLIINDFFRLSANFVPLVWISGVKSIWFTWLAGAANPSSTFLGGYWLWLLKQRFCCYFI